MLLLIPIGICNKATFIAKEIGIKFIFFDIILINKKIQRVLYKKWKRQIYVIYIIKIRLVNISYYLHNFQYIIRSCFS